MWQITKSLYDFMNVFGFLFNFLASWKSCVKEQLPKKSLYQQFWSIVMICYLRPKRGWNKYESLKSWHMTESAKDKQSWVYIQCLVKKSRASAVISQSWTFKTNHTQNLHFYAVCWHKQPPDDQTIQFWHQVSKQFGNLWATQFFWNQV